MANGLFSNDTNGIFTGLMLAQLLRLYEWRISTARQQQKKCHSFGYHPAEREQALRRSRRICSCWTLGGADFSPAASKLTRSSIVWNTPTLKPVRASLDSCSFPRPCCPCYHPAHQTPP